MLQVFESHADLLSPDLFNKFCLPVLNRIQVEVKARTLASGFEPVPMVCDTIKFCYNFGRVIVATYLGNQRI
jgi:uroporphyrinogen-III decarboxylase